MLKQNQKTLYLKLFLLGFGLAACIVAYVWVKMAVDPIKYLKISQTIFLIHTATTFYMVGLIWLVQIVNYPLFSKVGEDLFVAYHTSHVWRVTTVVAIPMLLEGMSAILMLWFPFPGISMAYIIAGVCLIFVLWLSTIFFQVPQHGILLKRYDIDACKRLNTTNWIRTLAWSARGLIVLVMLSQLFQQLK